MPHLIIDYDAALEADHDMTALCQQMFAVMAAQPCFTDPQAIKTRARPWPHHHCGPAGYSFAHATVQMMAGRTPGAKATLRDALTTALRQALPHVHSITLELRDMDRRTYGASILPAKGD